MGELGESPCQVIEKKPFEDGTILQSHSLGGPRESFAEDT